MRSLRLSFVFTLIVACSARAGALITLVPNPPGPYIGGEVLTVDVAVTTDRTILVRALGFDFSDTDASLTLLGPDGPDLDTTAEFVFDFSSLPVLGSSLYLQFANFNFPQIVYTSPNPITGAVLTLTAGVPFPIGSFQVKLPDMPTDAVIDVMNYDGEAASGARIEFFTSNTDDGLWTAQNGELLGGQLVLVCLDCIPEPATLAMLALGCALTGRRVVRR